MERSINMEEIIVHAVVYQVCTTCKREPKCFIFCDEVRRMIEDGIKMWKETKPNVLEH